MEYNRNSTSQPIIIEGSVTRNVLRSAFLWMAVGLALTGFTSWIMVEQGFAFSIMQSRGLFWGLCIAELAVVFTLSGAINKLSFGVATFLFGAYSVLNGVTLAPIFLMYTQESIATTFFITAGTFGVMAVYGYVTKRDLTKLGSILMMALIGLLLVMLVNFFLKSSAMAYVISAVGVLLFTGLTAYDVQKIKRLALLAGDDVTEQTQKLALLGALTLYLDFINLFLMLLRLFGSRD